MLTVHSVKESVDLDIGLLREAFLEEEDTHQDLKERKIYLGKKEKKMC